MKKLLFFSVLIIAAVSVKHSLKEPNLNELLLDNIEALGVNEQDLPHLCFGSGSVDCPGSGVKVKWLGEGYGLEKQY